MRGTSTVTCFFKAGSLATGSLAFARAAASIAWWQFLYCLPLPQRHRPFLSAVLIRLDLRNVTCLAGSAPADV